MAIIDLKLSAQLYDLYSQLKEAQQNADSWVKRVMDLTVQIKQLPNYIQNVSATEQAFVDNYNSISDVFNKNVPSDPDHIKK